MANLFRANKKGGGGIQVESLTVTSMPTKTEYVINDTLDLTGLVVTATFIDGVTADVTSAITTNPADGATLTTEGTIPVIITYQGATTSFNIACSTWDSNVMANNTWEAIHEKLLAGQLPSNFVGQTKEITLSTGETFAMQLASINDGTGDAGTYYPNHTADFISVELMDTTHAMNTSASNANGWPNSDLRTYLNETVYPTLPISLKDIIINKTHEYLGGAQSSGLFSASDKLWLPTYWELFGTGSEDQYRNNHYSIFSNNTSRIKYTRAAPTTYLEWWTSSAYKGNNLSFNYVNSDGRIDYQYYSSKLLSVAICFRIG